MKIYERVLGQIQENRERRLRGEFVSIPWSLSRISSALPGIEQGRYNLVSAPPKGGKTQFTDFLFMFEPIEWVLKNPNAGISLKIFYFSLEISKEAKIRAVISNKLAKDYGVIISPQKLMSVFNGYILDKKLKDIIESKPFIEYLDAVENIVEFHDEVRNPYGMFNTVKNYAESNGHYTTKTITWRNDDGSTSEKKVKDQYVPNNPNEFVIVIVDHISLLQAEKGQSLHQAIGDYSSKYALYMRDKWKYIPVVVQQQTANSSDGQWTGSGRFVIDKVKPTPEGLADNKYTARDVDLMLSLFDPSRFGLSEYKSWDLNRLFGYHREANINLNRNGVSNLSCPLYFNGAASYFKELPNSAEEKVYDEISRLERLTI